MIETEGERETTEKILKEMKCCADGITDVHTAIAISLIFCNLFSNFWID